MGQPSNSIARRLQHKVVSKLSNRNFMKRILPDDSLHVFDSLYSVLCHYYDEKSSEKVIKNILKLTTKLAMVFNDDKTVDKYEDALADVHEKLRALILTVSSFHDIAYSYSQTYLLQTMKEAEQSILALIAPVLSPKSSERVKHVFHHLSNPALLDALFKSESPHRAERTELIEAMEYLPF
ncbi:hypothetical protein M3Y94_00498900 [Aphelenchoides besseyi]|nr:hypothetical protein M3Y94_00498900 [Aphelenchoides besseyi]KAI6217287.1 hypothetical protein M3Y95_01225600 [Aphelenchoides besseyi]